MRGKKGEGKRVGEKERRKKRKREESVYKNKMEETYLLHMLIKD